MQATKSSKPELNRDGQSWLQNLDKLRRSSGLRIDCKGHWWHKKDRFEHPKIIATLNRGLAWEDQNKQKQQEEQISLAQLSTQVEDKSQAKLDIAQSRLVFEDWIGEATVQVGKQWCYIDCDYTPFLVNKLKAEVSRGELYVVLNTGEKLVLGPLGLKEDILYSRLTQNCLARFSVHAQMQVMEWLTEGEDDLGGQTHLKLVYQDREWPILSL